MIFWPCLHAAAGTELVMKILGLVQTMGYTHATDIMPQTSKHCCVLPLHLPWPRLATELVKVWSLALADEVSGLATLQWSLQAGFLVCVRVPCPQDTHCQQIGRKTHGPNQCTHIWQSATTSTTTSRSISLITF